MFLLLAFEYYLHYGLFSRKVSSISFFVLNFILPPAFDKICWLKVLNRTCLLVRSPCFFPPLAREQSSSEEVFFSGNYPQQGSFKGQRGSPGGLYAVQHQRNFQGKEKRL